ncbi:hypothetical protein VZT92_013613 [Zoarces viviparus]|uniref:Uncharacterized protein n=1 Tax=Zoarces viviparus TaxID=48416 RepID=A0AAW1F512_ZOAVI
MAVSPRCRSALPFVASVLCHVAPRLGRRRDEERLRRSRREERKEKGKQVAGHSSGFCRGPSRERLYGNEVMRAWDVSVRLQADSADGGGII